MGKTKEEKAIAKKLKQEKAKLESQAGIAKGIEIELLGFIKDSLNNDNCSWGKGPSRSRYYEPQYDLLIGIGKDNTATLRIGKSALAALGEFGDVSKLLK